jgi:hypothetical protein|nr:MAG TPA: hypothetical protein [Caudoviricetes sp.]DAY75349.1 MAG TPA: hypothetical protein [Caudoviricetes sp.]
MATVKRTSPTSLQVIKPDCLVATLYTGATTETADNPAGDTFIFDEVVRDTTTISQDDNDSTTIENEFSDDPILDIVSLGKFQFAAEVADIQTEILKNFANYTYDSTAKKLFAPAAYQKTYVKIDLVFKNGTDTDGSDKYMSICIPKLQLNSRLMVESMNSNIARLNLAGTATSVALTANGKTIKTAAYVNEDFTIPTETA